MNGENNGKPYLSMDDLGSKHTIFGNIQRPSKLCKSLRNGSCQCQKFMNVVDLSFTAFWFALSKLAARNHDPDMQEVWFCRHQKKIVQLSESETTPNALYKISKEKNYQHLPVWVLFV